MSFKTIRDKFAVTLGNSLDWYDFALYGYFAAIFAKLYFPNQDNLTSILSSLGTWSIGFAARPIGSLIFGSIGDKYGRVRAFKIASKLIFIPVCLIPILPTYEQIGIIAPLLLILCRIVQGICIGGEFAGGFIYLVESSPKNKTFFAGSLGSCTGLIGIITASFVSMLFYKFCTLEFIETIGFRIAFSFAIVFAFISYKLRCSISETLEYKELQQNQKVIASPLKEVFRFNKASLLKAFGLVFMHANTFYFVFIFLNIYKTQVLGIKEETSLSNNTLLLLINLISVPLIGKLADKIGGKKILYFSAIMFILFSYPLFKLIEVPKYTFLAMFLLSFMTILDSGVVPGLQVKVIPTKIRFTGMSLVFNVVWGIFGGSVPLICLWLIKFTGNKYIPSLYIIFSACITFITLFFIQSKPLDLRTRNDASA
ncbi:MAG: MFS transporter [Sphingobacteriia bacterium]|nr:MFS transporter [Sphingobacteriia bacterium]